MSYKQKWALGVNQDNVAVVMMAMVDVAIELLADPATDAGVAAYATSCLNSPRTFAEQMTLGVVFVATEVADAVIKSAVEQVFPAYAGLQAT